MHKIYLRDFYPPADVVIYALSFVSFSLLTVYYLSTGGSLRVAPYSLVAAISLLKILNALRVTTLFTTFISAGKKGILIRSYFSPSKAFSWQSIEKVEVLHDRLIVRQFEKEKKNSFYFSSFSDNAKQLTNLLKTIAPLEHRDKIG